jgi:hypothetical protein
MKKLLLLFLSVAIAVGASATVKSQGNAYRPMYKQSHAAMMKAPSRVDIITEQPEGQEVNYTRGGEFMYVSLYGYFTEAQIGQVKVVYADDGKTVGRIVDGIGYDHSRGIRIHAIQPWKPLCSVRDWMSTCSRASLS